jgi:hypothetical protein
MMLLSILFSLLLSLCFVANDVALYLTFVNSEPMPLCQWSFGCYTIWALVLSLSSLPSLACDEIVQLQKLFGIWADDLELVRNMTSLPAAPTVFVDMLTFFIYAHYFYDAFMLQVLDQIMMTCSETYYFCRYAHYFYRCSLCLYGHYFYICSLSLHMLTVLTYAHCFYICSLFLHMLTILIYAH